MEVAAVLLLLVTFFSVLHFLIFLKHRNNPKSPPTSLGWPIIGEHFSAFRDPDRFVKDRMAKYHPHRIFKTSFLGQPIFFFCGATSNRFIFSNENKLLVSWWPITVQKLAPLSLFNTVGNKAKQTRRLLMAFLSPDPLHRHVGFMDALARRHMVEEWEGREEVKAVHLIKSYTFDLICGMITGIEDPDQILRLPRLLSRFKVVLAGMFVLPLYFPGTWLYRAMRAAERIREELKVVIESRRREVVAGRICWGVCWVAKKRRWRRKRWWITCSC